MRSWTKLLAVAAPATAAAAGYLGLVTGAVALDLGVGRRSRPLGPQQVDIAAPREVVFDVIAQPYLGRPTHAMADKVRVLERGADLVLAAHHTPLRGRLVRGPVPHVTEEFRLDDNAGRTRLIYRGEMTADLWHVGQWWAVAVARRWEATVAGSLAAVKHEAERRARHP
jgi:hypothetical protein